MHTNKTNLRRSTQHPRLFSYENNGESGNWEQQHSGRRRPTRIVSSPEPPANTPPRNRLSGCLRSYWWLLALIAVGSGIQQGIQNWSYYHPVIEDQLIAQVHATLHDDQ